MQEVHFIEEADEAAELLKPIRIEILSRLSEPRACPELARDLGITTQKVNYHMNVLKDAGLVNLVEERRKRGTVEGVYQAVAKSFWFSPRLVKYLGDRERIQDQASLAYLLQLAEDLQLDIGQMIDRESQESLPSLGVNAQIQLRDGADRARFLAEIKEIFSHLAQKFGAATNNDDTDNDEDKADAGTYRLMLACYSGSEREKNNINRTNKDNHNG
jgi:DNA-binding transcriptional ArsR family regulator